MSTTASTSHADTVDDGNSPEAHEESNTQAKTSVDTSKLEKKAVDSATISNNKASTTENAKAGSVQTNKAANNTSAANNAQTSNKKTTTATDNSKAAAQLVKDATANTADLGKLSKNLLDHSNLDNLLRNSFVQTNSTDKVTLNANTLGSSLTNGDATALAASLRTASGNITATNGFFNLAPHNDLNINGNFTIVGADKNASINLNNNVIQNNPELSN